MIVTNVDQMVIVASAAEPRLKPALIDRYLVTAEKSKLRPVVCINKIDLVSPADLQPLAGVFSRMGYAVLMVSATTGQGIDRLRREFAGRATVIVGQSGVGKTSLLNAIELGLDLRVAAVSTETQKGKHTTTAARLVRLATSGGYVVDTPGIRQFQLWDVIPAEVAGYFRDLRPFINRCKYPNCSHRHETDCAVKDAVADGWLDARRYESYCQLFEEDENDLSANCRRILPATLAFCEVLPQNHISPDIIRAETANWVDYTDGSRLPEPIRQSACHPSTHPNEARLIRFPGTHSRANEVDCLGRLETASPRRRLKA